MQKKIEIPKSTTLVKAKEVFRFFNNQTGKESFEVKKDQTLELDNELVKDFMRQGLVEIVAETVETVETVETIEKEAIKEEIVVEIKPLKIKKHKEGE